ncbi:hypothetical protein KCP77_20580 [Salmonella enterica subsp. enterica]|nr:hypothetical protein KCP77_20580 [Salmonella enterica subsp. enterica]
MNFSARRWQKISVCSCNDLFAVLDVSDTLRRTDEDVWQSVCGGAAYGLRLHRLSGNEHAA